MKAGTTWQHAYLAASPLCAPAMRKEMHVLDVLDEESEAWKRPRVARKAARAAARAEAGGEVRTANLVQAAMIWEPSLYPTYFAGLLSGRTDDGAARFSLDITPSYAVLRPPRLTWVRESFAALGVRTVATFLMRDPVDRLHSHVRFAQSRRPDDFPLSPEEHVRQVYAEPAYEHRGRYERTLESIAATFAPAEVHLGLYETFFTEESIGAMCRTIGIDPHPADFDHRPWHNPAARGISEETERLVAEHYASTYAAVADAFPGVDLRDVWPSSRWVL